MLGARRGAICVGIYLAVGLSGIPVFAAGGGPAYLIPSNIRIFTGLCILLPGSQESCPPFAREQVLPGICSVPSGG